MKKKVIDLESLVAYEEYDKPSACDKCGGGLRYEGVGEYRCETCGNIQYDAYGTVRRYVESHPMASIVSIERATGISTKIISALVRDGKFSYNRGEVENGGENE